MWNYRFRVFTIGQYLNRSRSRRDRDSVTGTHKTKWTIYQRYCLEHWIAMWVDIGWDKWIKRNSFKDGFVVLTRDTLSDWNWCSCSVLTRNSILNFRSGVISGSKLVRPIYRVGSRNKFVKMNLALETKLCKSCQSTRNISHIIWW